MGFKFEAANSGGLRMGAVLAAGLLSLGLCLAQSPTPQSFGIRGAVSEASSQRGIPDAVVTVSGAQGKTDLETDQSGHYSIDGMAAGNYFVYAQKPGYGGRISRIRHIHLALEAPMARVDFRLPKESAVSGRVFDLDKKPIAGARVRVSKIVYRRGRAGLMPRGEARTDASGKYRVNWLDEGSYFVDVDAARPEIEILTKAKQAEGDESAMKLVHTFYPNATSPEGAVPIRVSAGEEQFGTDVRMALTLTHCVIASSSFDRAAIAAVWFPLPQGARQLTGGLVPPNARFRFCGLGEGSYRLTLTDKDTSGGEAAMFAEPFDIGKHDSDLGTVVPRAGLRVSGRVLLDAASADQTVPLGIQISLDPADDFRFAGEALSAPVSDLGAFEIPNVLGGVEYRLAVYSLPPAHYVKSATMGSHDAKRETVMPADGTVTVVLSADGGRIKGSVVASDGLTPVPDADVAMVPVSSSAGSLQSQVLTTVADQNGAFEFRGIEPGEYRLFAIEEALEGEAEDPNVLRKLYEVGSDVKVKASSSLALTIKALRAHPER